jgi:hypothetical protein
MTLHFRSCLSSRQNNNNTRPKINVLGKTKKYNDFGFCQKGWVGNCITCFAAFARARDEVVLSTRRAVKAAIMMVWTYTFVLSVCLQLLKLYIAVAVSGFVVVVVDSNFFLTLKRKARVLKIRALRALDSTGAATGSAPADCAASRVAARPELWGIIAGHSGLVGAWRLTGVCRASREGAKEWLRTLPGLVVCGGVTTTRGEALTSDVWRLDLGELRWERMLSLTRERYAHACCAVRGGVVVLGAGVVLGQEEHFEHSASVEILGCNSAAAEEEFTILPLLSLGPISGSAAIAIDESESDQGQVLLLGGWVEDGGSSSAVHKVDLATGVCTPQPSLLSQHGVLLGRTAARLADGRIVCVGKCANSLQGTAQLLEPPPPELGSPSEASWQWRYLPGICVGREYGGGCVLSDGRFAVFGGTDYNSTTTASCEVLTLDAEIERWDPLQPMHEARQGFACAAIGGCVIVAGGQRSRSAEVYEEALGRWRRPSPRYPSSLDGQRADVTIECTTTHHASWLRTKTT